MKIYRLSRPPIRNFFTQFPQTRDFLFQKLEGSGYEIRELPIIPVKVPNRYLSYGLGTLLTLYRLPKMKPDVILADNIESGMVALAMKCLFRTPFVFHFLDDYSLIASYDRWRMRYRVLKCFERIIPKYADLVIVVDSLKKGYCADCGIPESRIRMIPNGVDITRFKPQPTDQTLRRQFGLSHGKIAVFVGKINRYYRLDVVLKAVPLVFETHPDTQFLLVGDGDALEELKGLCRDLGIERSVFFAGFRPPEEIPRIMNLSDLCIFPLPDSSALVLFEYMACGKPVVLPRGGTQKMGIPREMIPEDCAVQVDPTPGGFAAGIVSILENSQIGEEIGQKARDLAMKVHDWNRLAVTCRDALEETFGAHPRTR